MPFVGLVIAMCFFFHHRRDWYRWQRSWAERLQRDGETLRGRAERHRHRHGRDRWGGPCSFPDWGDSEDETADRRSGETARRDDERATLSPEEEAQRRARRRAAAEAGFYGHLASYLAVITLLAVINFVTMPFMRTPYPWFIWPAFGWGIGVFSHYMAVFGSRMLRERFFDPALERELRRERVFVGSPGTELEFAL